MNFLLYTLMFISLHPTVSFPKVAGQKTLAHKNKSNQRGCSLISLEDFFFFTLLGQKKKLGLQSEAELDEVIEAFS